MRVAIPAGTFYAPKNMPMGFYISKNCVFEGKPRECVSPFPQGLFMPPKARRNAFSAAKMLFWLGKHTLIALIPTYVGICVSPSPQGLFLPPGFSAAKMYRKCTGKYTGKMYGKKCTEKCTETCTENVRKACWLAGLLACWLAGLLACLLACLLAGWLACWLAGFKG